MHEPMRRVLHATDGSSAAFDATLFLIDVSRRHGVAELHLANVQPWSLADVVRGRGAHPGGDWTMAHHLQTRASCHALNKADLPYALHLLRGDVAEALADLSEELDCSHIVLGSIGKPKWLASVRAPLERRLARLTTIPVVRAPRMFDGRSLLDPAAAGPSGSRGGWRG